MEHTLGITAAALITVAALVLCAFALSGFFREEAPAGAVQSGVSAQENLAEAKTQMRLGIYRGYLALFTGTEETPAETYDVMVRTLPEADRARLIAGIAVENEEELRRLLEDFTS